MASQFATLAFHWAGRSNRYPDQLDGKRGAHAAQKLYYLSAEAPLRDRQGVALAPISATIDTTAQLETRINAFKAHATQAPLWARVEQRVREHMRQEKFHLAASMRPGPVAMETDLFAGVLED
jgi:LmbE family N-acetylglucosaminyl deacetylase